MTTEEQAFLDGFVKRAAQYGISPKQALDMTGAPRMGNALTPPKAMSIPGIAGGPQSLNLTSGNQGQVPNINNAPQGAGLDLRTGGRQPVMSSSTGNPEPQPIPGATMSRTPAPNRYQSDIASGVYPNGRPTNIGASFGR